jgi:hypothetical protein
MPIKNYDKVQLLLPMTGSNNGTVFADYSLRQQVVTRTAGAITSTTRSKFNEYGSSGYFDGASVLTVPEASWNDFSTGSFCVEFWYFIPTGTGISDPNLRLVAVKWGSAAQMICGFGVGEWKPMLALYSGGDGTFCISDDSVSLNQWRHFAATYDGSNMRVFDNGTLKKTLAFDDTIDATNGAFAVGAFAWGSSGFLGNVQDFLVTNGAAKYTANFTPPDRMTQRELTRVNTGTDSHEFDRAVLFDWNVGAGNILATSVEPDSDGDFVADDLIDLEYGIAYIKDGCAPICHGPYEVDEDDEDEED